MPAESVRACSGNPILYRNFLPSSDWSERRASKRPPLAVGRRLREVTVPHGAKMSERRELSLQSSTALNRVWPHQLVELHYNQVGKWRRRFVKGGLWALQDRLRADRKRNIATELLRQISDQATGPPQGGPRWICRATVHELGAAKAAVRLVGSHNKIKPHLTRVFKAFYPALGNYRPG
jgi:hypothetical protein